MRFSGPSCWRTNLSQEIGTCHFSESPSSDRGVVYMQTVGMLRPSCKWNMPAVPPSRPRPVLYTGVPIFIVWVGNCHEGCSGPGVWMQTHDQWIGDDGVSLWESKTDFFLCFAASNAVPLFHVLIARLYWPEDPDPEFAPFLLSRCFTGPIYSPL